MRHNIVGALGFTSHRKNFNSWAIRTHTRSEFSHVFIVIGMLYGMPIVLEADEGRVDINLMSKYTLNKDIKLELYDLNLDRETLHSSIIEITRKFEQVVYGHKQILGFGLEAVGWKRNPFRRGMICSELAIEYTRLRGVIDGFEDINLVDPKEVRNLAISIEAEKIGEKQYRGTMSWKP